MSSMSNKRKLLYRAIVWGSIPTIGLCSVLSNVHAVVSNARNTHDSAVYHNANNVEGYHEQGVKKKKSRLSKNIVATDSRKKVQKKYVFSDDEDDSVVTASEEKKYGPDGIEAQIMSSEGDASNKVKSDLIVSNIAAKKAGEHHVINVPNTKVTLGGSIDVEAGMISQRENFRTRGPDVGDDWESKCATSRCSTPRAGLVENAKLKMLLSRVEKDMEYGLYFGLNANPGVPSDGYSGNDMAFGYVQGKYGRVEVGNNVGAILLLKIDAASIAVATGGIDGDYTDWTKGRDAYYTYNTNYRANMGDLFENDPYLSYEDRTQKKANKVTYISPTVNGFTVGVGYVPSTKIRGTSYNISQFASGMVYKNVFEGIVKYTMNTDKPDKVGFGISAGGEFGSADSFTYQDSASSIVQEKKLDDLAAWQVGAELTYGGFVLAGSYGNSGKSGMIKDEDLIGGLKKQQSFWTGGIAYNRDKIGLSATFLQSRSAGLVATYKDGNAVQFVGYRAPEELVSNAKANVYQALSLGAQYSVMPGLLPYAEVTFFNYKSCFSNVSTNKGAILILGTRVSF